MNAMKLIMSLGGAIAAAKTVKSLTNFGVDDALDYVGLERRRSHIWERLAFFGVGALAGASAGLLLAPSSGRETRQKIGDGADKLATKAGEALALVEKQAPAALAKVTHSAAPGVHRRVPGESGSR